MRSVDEKRIREQIVDSVNAHCSHLTPDPYLKQKVLLAAREKERVQVKKLPIGMILAILMMLLTMTAVAAVLLSGTEFIEQIGVPLSKQNDADNVRPVLDFTHEEIAELVTKAAENGILLDDDSKVMQAFRSGEGYYEEEAIMEICRSIFGGLYYEWTQEQRHWYQDVMVAIGWQSENYIDLPGEGELSCAEARKLAYDTMYAHYGADVPLTDPALYRLEESFTHEPDNEDGANWTFKFYPKTLAGDTYYVSMDAKGEWVNHSERKNVLTASYNESILMAEMNDTWGYKTRSQESWSPEGWVQFGEHLKNARHSDGWDAEYDAYLQTTYLLPSATDLTQAEVKAIITEAIKNAGIASGGTTSYTMVLVADGDKRVWKASFWALEEIFKTQAYTCEVDAQTGHAGPLISLDGRESWSAYVLNRTYMDMVHGGSVQQLLTRDEAVTKALAAFRKAAGADVPYEDPEIYELETRLHGDGSTYRVTLKPLVMGYGYASASVDTSTGEVKITRAEAPAPVTADTLMSGYSILYGGCNSWPQDTWVKFGEDIRTYDAPTTFEAQLYLATTYLPESEAKVSREKAIDIAFLDNGDVAADCVCAVLIQGENGPVWKLRMGTWPMNTLYEVDGLTGAILDKEDYVCQHKNFDHDMKEYTLRSTFMPAYLAEYGATRVAWEYFYKQHFDALQSAEIWEEAYLEGTYFIHEDGLTVTFAAVNEWNSSWRVTIAEDAMSAEVVQLTAEEVQAAFTHGEEGSIAWCIAQWGRNSIYWPLEYQVMHDESGTFAIPGEGDLSEEEAIAMAKQAVIGQEGADALAPMWAQPIGRSFLRIKYARSEEARWYVYLIWPDEDGKLQNGWVVNIFTGADGVHRVEVVSTEDEGPGVG